MDLENLSQEEEQFNKLLQQCQDQGITKIENYLEDIFSFEKQGAQTKNGEFTKSKRLQLKSIICLALLGNSQQQMADKIYITLSTLKSSLLSRTIYPMLTLLIESRGTENPNLLEKYPIREQDSRDLPNRINDWRCVSALYYELYETHNVQSKSEYIKEIKVIVTPNTPEDIKNEILVDFQTNYPTSKIDLDNN